MRKTMLGIIDAMTETKAMRDLTEVRSLAAVPFGGRYRLIDFTLSNLVNSGIHSVAIFTKDRFRSLMDHLGSGRDWDLNRKRGGLFFFPPTSGQEYFNGFFDYFQHHIDYFYRTQQKYAVIADSNVIYNLDFKKVLNRHIESHADITEVCYQGRPLNIAILEKSLLLDFIQTYKYEPFINMRDFIAVFRDRLNIHSYEHDGYTAIIDSVDSYYKHSMEMLCPDMWRNLFLNANPIYTKVKDEPPTRYGKEALVTNSQVANGCIINGTVDSSILSRAVHIGKGAVIKNSIIMQKCTIEDGAIIDGAVIDKDARIQSGAHVIGTAQVPVVVRKGMTQGAMMNS
ncbi:sugar phosphate nucleotidyltransferase [Bacillus tianshenii]|nr:sugar phosphate nucleotidyltransferase [Bacillus tianshenii]